MGTDASDLIFCYFLLEFGEAPDASPEEVNKINQPWCYEPFRHSERSEAFVPIRSIRVPAFS